MALDYPKSTHTADLINHKLKAGKKLKYLNIFKVNPCGKSTIPTLTNFWLSSFLINKSRSQPLKDVSKLKRR